jgi:hypothetical protein
MYITCKFDNITKMKVHLKNHSFKKLDFKCEDCEYFGPNEMTMEVHYGRKHSEVPEFGLCENKANSEEDLATHLVTCTIYDCKQSVKIYRDILYKKNLI